MKEAVILVGMQGSGKTRYCLTALPHHTRISQDEGPRKFEGIIHRYRELLEKGTERIVIDRINPIRPQRKQFADLARACGYRVRIIYFDIPRGICEERIRRRRDHPTLAPGKMPEAIRHYEDLLEIPTADECDELVIIRQDDPPGG